MPLSIKNNSTEILARDVARLAGETITEAIRVALAERYERLKGVRSGRGLGVELNEIALRCAQRPLISTLSDDEILGYDEFGAPTR